ncbi:hypothetical protein NQ318_000286 [Aromia moschata]|uniref:DUF4817 domain-containing protein n=1 Tax=Aromia moschata TaxID=1265417 RepID=A0AAV8YW86_9CUCU|nr:hypothetical protein NQ318_000286 [Aromia moschata]
MNLAALYEACYVTQFSGLDAVPSGLRCGDKTRTPKQVCEIFNTKYPDRRISQFTVSRIENKFREFGNVTNIPKAGRKRILDDEQRLDILLDIQDNPHKPTRQVAADNDRNNQDEYSRQGAKIIKKYSCDMQGRFLRIPMPMSALHTRYSSELFDREKERAQAPTARAPVYRLDTPLRLVLYL